MTPPLLIVIPLTAADLPLASAMLQHLATHGPLHHHSVLFVADKGLTREQVAPLETLGRTVFPAGGEGIHTPLALTPTYPHGYNLRFETAAKHIAATRRTSWLWLDPRCVAVRAAWLTVIEAEYNARRRPILGQVLTPAANGTAQPLVSSTAVYPAELPKRALQRLVARRDVDFEKSCADLFVPLAHASQLIWVHPLNGTQALPMPPPTAVLVHTAFAKPFAASLRGELLAKMESAPAAVAIEPPTVESVTPALPAAPTSPRSTYYHSGDLGDIIYALAAIKLAGGGNLLLGPRSLRTPPPANPMREEQFERFAPLLRVQPYLSRVTFTDRYPGTDNAFDVNRFRCSWDDKALRARTGISTLARMHCHTLGVDERFHPHQTWLAVPDPITLPYFVIHRSPRYHWDNGSPDGTLSRQAGAPFPWSEVLKHFAGRLLFIGLPTEHADFERAFNVRLPFWKCIDFLEMARLIAGAKGFIGNQSFPNAIALGCGQRVLQESWPVSPDCVFARANFLTQPFKDEQLEKWESAAGLEPLAAIVSPPREAVEIVAQPRRHVSTTPINGLIELGPLERAFGLGDTLTITPLAARLGQRCVVCLPPEIKRFAPLFAGLCPTRVTDDYPVFPCPPSARFIESKLRLFGFECEDGKVAPVVKLKGHEVTNAKRKVKSWRDDKPWVVLQTECSKEWMHIRSRPREWWEPVLSELADRFNVIDLSIGPKLPLRELTALMRVIGRCFTVNTGTWHLAVSQGCRCLCIDADECEGYDPALWRYTLSNIEYSGFDHANIIAKIPWLLK